MPQIYQIKKVNFFLDAGGSTENLCVLGSILSSESFYELLLCMWGPDTELNDKMTSGERSWPSAVWLFRNDEMVQGERSWPSNLCLEFYHM